MSVSFPVGLVKFHRNKLFNFQLNRWYSFGWPIKEEALAASKRIKDFKTWKTSLVSSAKKAEEAGKTVTAAFLYRAADFFTFPDDPDKAALYETFSALFDRAYGGETERHKVPFGESFLPAIRLKSNDVSKGTILVMGGFDSYIEEFYKMMRYLADGGYDVIGFEGPGQGAALKKYGLLLDLEYEKPVGAVLDYFHKNEATLFGISMGGYWCIRASAFEKRIKRVIASSVVYDWMEAPGAFTRSVVEWMFRHPRLMEFSMKAKMRFSKYNNWVARNWMYITGEKTPLEAARHILMMNSKNLHSEQVTQDILILTGEDDSFCPLKLHSLQVQALKNARVTSRIFTKEEHAASHCQIGNVGLAMEVILDWLKKTEETNAAENIQQPVS